MCVCVCMRVCVHICVCSYHIVFTVALFPSLAGDTLDKSKMDYLYGRIDDFPGLKDAARKQDVRLARSYQLCKPANRPHASHVYCDFGRQCLPALCVQGRGRRMRPPFGPRSRGRPTRTGANAVHPSAAAARGKFGREYTTAGHGRL